MPNSVRENDAHVRAFVSSHVIDTALDVGPGEGTYHRILSDLIPDMDAVEIWEKNITDFSLRNRYRAVAHADIREYIDVVDTYDTPSITGPYDLIIFGDVLEHMSVSDAIIVFQKALDRAPYVLVSVPIHHFPQEPIDGNEAERHLIEDPRRELIPYLGKPLYQWEYAVTGTYIYRGNYRGV